MNLRDEAFLVEIESSTHTKAKKNEHYQSYLSATTEPVNIKTKMEWKTCHFHSFRILEELEKAFWREAKEKGG